MSPADPERGLTPVGADRCLPMLEHGDLEVLGYLPYASNVTLLATVRFDGAEGLAVYKPRRGESPLWDFPSGTLCLREYAAWVVDRALGWMLVPATVLRDGPAGFGAVQAFVDEDPEADLEVLLHAGSHDLKRMAAFDVVVNNADRKGGHCIIDTSGKLWGVDHGVCFNADYKLRTVIWAFQGEAIPEDIVADLEDLRSQVGARSHPTTAALERLLDDEEMEALLARLDALVSRRRFPSPGGRRSVPWPPW